MIHNSDAVFGAIGEKRCVRRILIGCPGKEVRVITH